MESNDTSKNIIIDESRKIITSVSKKAVMKIVRRYTAKYFLQAFINYALYDYKLLYLLILALL